RGHTPGDLPAETGLDFTITAGATPPGGGTKPPGASSGGMAAETRPRREPRKITEGPREPLFRTLREDPKVPLAVVSLSGDNESYAFARNIGMLFDIAGWPTRGVSQQAVSDVPPGLTFVSKRGDAAVSARAALLPDTLAAV